MGRSLETALSTAVSPVGTQVGAGSFSVDIEGAFDKTSGITIEAALRRYDVLDQ